MRVHVPNRLLLGAMAVVIVGLILPLFLTFGAMAWGIRAGHQRCRHLLLDADFEVLLKACDDLSQRVIDGKLKHKQYMVRRDPDPEALSFPQPILDLKPTYVCISETGIVCIELYGIWHQYGVQAVPPGYAGFPPGDVELIPRLWYYDDHYDKDPGCREGIAALLEQRRSQKTR